MMKLVGIVLVLSVILFTRAAGFAQQAAQPSGDETKILALENAWNRALELHDVQGIAGLVDDTLANIRPSGVLENKTQYLARVKGSPGEKVEQAVNESQTVRIYGNCAVVTGIYRTKGLENGKPYLHRTRFSDTWVYKNGKWVIVLSQETFFLHSDQP